MQNQLELNNDPNELQNQVIHHIISKALMLAAKMGLSNYLSDVPVKMTTLAASLGYHPKAAERLFKLLETLNLLKITDEGLVVATSLTPHLHQICSEHYFGSFKAFNHFQHSLENNTECWSNAFGKPFYAYLEERPEQSTQFHRYLEETAECWLNFIPNVFDFSIYKTVVDVGGGKGRLLAEIFEKNNNSDISGVLFEKPELRSDATDYLTERNIHKKVSFFEGNFLTDRLPEGDIYILCRVLLNWNDDDAIKIIRNCLNNAGGKKVIIIDFVVPDKSHKHYQRALLHDLNLLAVFGGKIRSLSDWESLTTKATDAKVNFEVIDDNTSGKLNVPMIFIEISGKFESS